MIQKVFVISLVACLAATATALPVKSEINQPSENLISRVSLNEQDVKDQELKFFFPFLANIFNAFQPQPIWWSLPQLDNAFGNGNSGDQPTPAAPADDATTVPSAPDAPDAPDADPPADAEPPAEES